MSGDIYKLLTISDLLTVPVEKRETCMRDLLLALSLVDLSLGEDGMAATKEWFWTDDNDPSCSISVNGETQLTLKIRDAQ
jgi:hypothetical protein